MNKIMLDTAIGLQDFAPLANTRSLELLKVTLRIFTALHVNKTLKTIMLSFVKGLKIKTKY
ncbi:hypothetical protein [Holospora elegans]|uniref:hypothetical protein n=1 Tax=Holospora elegans TaxID=431043 RepID=UPI00139F2C90|nr:hypothetical protein [Holospora elegans]